MQQWVHRDGKRKAWPESRYAQMGILNFALSFHQSNPNPYIYCIVAFLLSSLTGQTACHSSWTTHAIQNQPLIPILKPSAIYLWDTWNLAPHFCLCKPAFLYIPNAIFHNPQDNSVSLPGPRALTVKFREKLSTSLLWAAPPLCRLQKVSFLKVLWWVLSIAHPWISHKTSRHAPPSG